MNELDCNPIIVKTKLEQEDFISVRYALTKFKSSRFIKPLAIYLILFVVILFILTLYTSNPPSSVQDSSTPIHSSSASLHPFLSYLSAVTSKVSTSKAFLVMSATSFSNPWSVL